MSRSYFSSSLALSQSVSGSDSDGTSNSTSSGAINNSSSSLSISPSGVAIQTRVPTSRTGCISLSLFDQHLSEPFKINSFNKLQHQPNISNHLLELQREIKEEEEEIFALINDRSNLYSSFDDDTDDLDDHLGGNANTLTNLSCQPFSVANDNKNNIDLGYNLEYSHDDNDQGLHHESGLINDENSSHNQQYLTNSEDCSDNINNNSINSHNRYYENQDYVLCNRATGQQQNQDEPQQYTELEHGDENENQHLTDGQMQEQEDELAKEQQHLDDYQRDLQQLTSNLPKPCVFFLEGNCRRSDCKYSHDLSSITCKYWIEGFCFKGDSCPFLHSFNQKGQISNLLDDDIELAKKKLNPTFAIESEADFPSLPMDAPNVTLSTSSTNDMDPDSLTRTIENQILSSNPSVVFKITKKKRKKG